jgi:hypothetical protein
MQMQRSSIEEREAYNPLTPEYGSEKVVARVFGLTEGWLQKARVYGGNDAPPFVKIGGKILYHLPTLRDWFAARSMTSTLAYTSGAAGQKRRGRPRKQPTV